MPWKASSVMEERVRFILEYEEGEEGMTELCQRYEISRETGYVTLHRYRACGLRGLLAQSHAAQRHHNQTEEEIEEQVLELRQTHMRWGPRKLKRILERDEPWRNWPASSTIEALLKREGLVVPRKKRLHTAPYMASLAHAEEVNRVWCADFKGWFRTADGERIDPLTISDAYSRYLLRCQTVEKTNTERVQAIFEAAFREYGMPEAMRTHNGPPFASHAVAGLSRLAVWWIKLGIVPERIAAGHPEQNGRHERMHRTMEEEVAQPPAANRPSAREFPSRVPEPEYPRYMQVRSVRPHGHFRWKQHDVFLSEVLWSEQAGLLREDDRWFTVYFAPHPIALFDSPQLRGAPLLTNSSHFEEREEDASPSVFSKPLAKPNQKVSDIRPV
ncbi:MAG: DDE-type integrase/transposase/recombinase [Candidatus Acidiferrum sp.]